MGKLCFSDNLGINQDGKSIKHTIIFEIGIKLKSKVSYSHWSSVSHSLKYVFKISELNVNWRRVTGLPYSIKSRGTRLGGDENK